MPTPPTPPPTPTIRTPRLVLRARTPADAAALFPALADPAQMIWWSRPAFADLAELRAYFAAQDGGGSGGGGWGGGGWRAWAIVEPGEDGGAGGDRAIGFVAAGEKRQGGVSEIGYFLARAAHGRGLAREAVAALVGQLFGEGQRRVFADTDPDNRASIALLERLGFRCEGRLRGEWQTHIGVRDSLIYGLLAEEWRRPADG